MFAKTFFISWRTPKWLEAENSIALKPAPDPPRMSASKSASQKGGIERLGMLAYSMIFNGASGANVSWHHCYCFQQPPGGNRHS
jgi:hypothetical protein